MCPNMSLSVGRSVCLYVIICSFTSYAPIGALVYFLYVLGEQPLPLYPQGYGRQASLRRGSQPEGGRFRPDVQAVRNLSLD